MTHFVGSSIEIRRHVFGIESSLTECSEEFTLHLNENGGGYIADPQVTGCAYEACYTGSDMGDIEPWAFWAFESGGSNEAMTIAMCHEELGFCEIDIPLSSTAMSHMPKLGRTTEMPGHGVAGGAKCELVGEWLMEASEGQYQEIEVTHHN